MFVTTDLNIINLNYEEKKLTDLNRNKICHTYTDYKKFRSVFRALEIISAG